MIVFGDFIIFLNKSQASANRQETRKRKSGTLPNRQSSKFANLSACGPNFPIKEIIDNNKNRDNIMNSAMNFPFAFSPTLQILLCPSPVHQ